MSQELLLRWLEFGSVAGIMRDETQGSCGPERAQLFDSAESVRVWRKFSKLRTALWPYLYRVAHEARSLGLPVMRHHVLVRADCALPFPSRWSSPCCRVLLLNAYLIMCCLLQTFPGDAAAVAQEYQYMLGDMLLVAPVITPNTSTQQVCLVSPSGLCFFVSDMSFATILVFCSYLACRSICRVVSHGTTLPRTRSTMKAMAGGCCQRPRCCQAVRLSLSLRRSTRSLCLCAPVAFCRCRTRPLTR